MQKYTPGDELKHEFCMRKYKFLITLNLTYKQIIILLKTSTFVYYTQKRVKLRTFPKIPYAQFFFVTYVYEMPLKKFCFLN